MRHATNGLGCFWVASRKRNRKQSFSKTGPISIETMRSQPKQLGLPMTGVENFLLVMRATINGARSVL